MKKKNLLVLFLFVPAILLIIWVSLLGQLVEEYEISEEEKQQQIWDEEVLRENARALYQRENCGDGWAEYDSTDTLVCLGIEEPIVKQTLFEFLNECKDRNGFIWKFSDSEIWECKDKFNDNIIMEFVD